MAWRKAVSTFATTRGDKRWRRTLFLGFVLGLNLSTLVGDVFAEEAGSTAKEVATDIGEGSARTATKDRGEREWDEDREFLEFLEFLGEWETNDGQWLDPMQLEETDLEHGTNDDS